MSNADLLALSSRELRALQSRIEDTIRTKIREKKAKPAKPEPPAPAVFSIEVERDRWLEAKYGRRP